MAPSSGIPIYPRPVSPLSVESLYMDPLDILYEHSRPSSDDDSDDRAAKRRRISNLGEHYLRGNDLHILSAGLKGPFNSKWKNPWANRGRDAKQAVAEIPETAGRPVKKLQAHRYGRAKARNHKIEEWLRRSSAYSGLEFEEQSSPTPVRTKKVDIGYTKPLKLGAKVATEDALCSPPRRLDAASEIHEIVGHSVSHNHDAQSAAREGADHPHRSKAEPTPIERRAWVSHAANADRAEYAAAKLKRRGIEIAPSSTMLSAFEYRRVSDAHQKPQKSEEVRERREEENKMAPPAITQQRNLHQDEERHTTSDKFDPMTSTSPAIPALSTDTSRGSVTNLPSAQPQSLDAPAPFTNDSAFEEKTLERQLDPITSTKEPLLHMNREILKDDGSTVDVNSCERKSISEQNQILRALGGAEQTQLPTTVAKVKLVPDTQEMLAGMSPVVFSTVKRAIDGIERLTMPVTATKQRPEKSGRTISSAQGRKFSSSPSQGSLKTSLRVSKGGLLVAFGKENDVIGVGEEEPNKQSSDSSTRSVKERPLPAADVKGLKSALRKSSEPPVRTAPFPSTKGSTGTGIDGGQNVPVMGEDEMFDLEGAMDGLGSYLGTWDAEKEASSIGIDM